MHNTSRILLPLDTDTADKALALAEGLRNEVAGFKVGLELINSAGFDMAPEWLRREMEAAGELHSDAA